ncbi:NPC1-like intracellular cholesterol transporter 1 [Dermacentor andersoni]|uniref:NPC1-like intracellular cholesterol transporter 1 n=1 Tax=Dermacentor andersoni TaxID=34620 RepID=UPI0024168FA9|nr:NPC1-like intracellular cholesterol transporter 1 [Dermacentor andersoni]
MSSSWLFTVAFVTYGYCGKDEDSGKPLPCAVKRDPVPIESSILKDACPALIDSSGPCFRNFQNLVCQAFCSPKQSEFVAINGTSSEGSDQPSATESVYAVHKTFAEKVYDSCKGVRTYVFWTKLMSYMCGKHGASGCSAQRFLDFVGSTYSEGGYSPIKIRHVLTEGPITVAGQKLEPFNPKFL